LGVDIEVHVGETLIEAAWREGLYWPTVCYGQAQCMACHVIVREGAENLAEMGSEEAEAMQTHLRGTLRTLDNRRLACRLEVKGPAVVEKRGVRARSAP
jgi:2Fe-2S ferredoxin